MKIKDLSQEQLLQEMEKVKSEVAARYGFLHKSRRYVALQNEREIRSGYIVTPKLLKEFQKRKLK